LDVSGSINDCLHLDTVKLDSIEVVIPKISQGCFFASWDLSGMYHQGEQNSYKSGYFFKFFLGNNYIVNLSMVDKGILFDIN
jgi:hypothetical protein